LSHTFLAGWLVAAAAQLQETDLQGMQFLHQLQRLTLSWSKSLLERRWLWWVGARSMRILQQQQQHEQQQQQQQQQQQRQQQQRG
jgi:hypothetical protein